MFEHLFEREAAGNGGKGHSSSEKFAPNTKIAYKSTLIPALHKRNMQLLMLYDQASRAARARDAKQTKKLLGQFKHHFVNHVLHQNTSLYIYLEHSANDSTSRESIHFMKLEMGKIARDVVSFVSYGVEESTFIDIDFVKMMDEVAELLHFRVNEEENFVYPHYLTKG